MSRGAVTSRAVVRGVRDDAIRALARSLHSSRDRAHPARFRPSLHPAPARLGGPLGAALRPRRPRRRPARHQLDRLARRAVDRHPALPRAAAGGRQGRHRLGQPRPDRPRCAGRAVGPVARRGPRRRRADRRRLAERSATPWSRSARGGTARPAGPPSRRSSRPMRGGGRGAGSGSTTGRRSARRPAGPAGATTAMRMSAAGSRSTSPISSSPAMSTSRRSSRTDRGPTASAPPGSSMPAGRSGRCLAMWTSTWRRERPRGDR